MVNEIVWNGLGLSENKSGIESVAIAFSWQLFDFAPEVAQVIFVSEGCNWSGELAPSCTVHRLPRRRFDLVRSIDLGGKCHSWAKSLNSRDETYLSSYTIHDWGPFHDITMPVRHRLIWTTSILNSIRRANAIHMLNQSILHSAPVFARDLLASKNLVFSEPPIRMKQPSRLNFVNGKFFLSVGSNLPRKNMARLAQIWSEGNFFKIHGIGLKLIGAGTEELTSENVEGLGFVSDELLSGYMISCEALICISDYEGQNIPIAEALSFGKPVISTRASSTAYSEAQVIKIEFPTLENVKNAVTFLMTKTDHSTQYQSVRETNLLDFLLNQ